MRLILMDLVSSFDDSKQFYKKYFKYINQVPSLVKKQLDKTDLEILKNTDLWSFNIQNFFAQLSIVGEFNKKKSKMKIITDFIMSSGSILGNDDFDPRILTLDKGAFKYMQFCIYLKARRKN